MNLQHRNTFHNPAHLAVIRVSGDDAATFLQGQLTCDIRSLSDSKASIAAFCNAKGRVISTLLLIKHDADYWLILPRSLLDKVLNKLRLYVLRSKVQLGDASDSQQLIGLCSTELQASSSSTEDAYVVSHDIGLRVRLPGPQSRYLCLCPSAHHAEMLQTLQDRGFIAASSEHWRHDDIASGLPWFEIERSEQFIPQMLNIDGLGGISFNKGCYTGQEIIARTHYLGKSKRQLFKGVCEHDIISQQPLHVLCAESREKCGDVLTWQNFTGKCQLLLILQNIDERNGPLMLDDAPNTVLTLIPDQ